MIDKYVSLAVITNFFIIIVHRSLTLYSLYHSLPVKLVRNLAILVVLILPFFEYPNSISASSDFRYQPHLFRMPEPPCGVTETVELVCLLIFMVDCIIRFSLVGFKRFLRQKWLVVYTILVLLSFVDLFVSVGLCHYVGQSSLAGTLRLRRFFRPLFFIVPSSIMKKFIKSVGRTIQNIVGVFVLLIIHIYVFAMIGMLIFPEPVHDLPQIPVNNTTNGPEDIPWEEIEEGNNSYPMHSFIHAEGAKYFNTVEDSIISLIVFLTTANNPDVMTPVYQGSRISFIYFFLFLSIGLYLILNLFTAAVYSGFRGYIEQSMQSSFFRRRVAFRAAFAVLSQVSPSPGADRNLVRQLLQKAKISKKQLPAMHTLLETTNIDQHGLTWESFRGVFDLCTNAPAGKVTEEVEYYSRFKVLELVQRLVRNPFFQYFSIFMTLVHVALLTVEMEIDYVEVIKHSNSVLAVANFVYFFYYFFEQAVKIVGLGRRGYFLSVANLFEGVVTLFILVTELIILCKFDLPFKSTVREPRSYYTYIQLMNLFIVVRLLRIISQFKSVSIAFGSMMEIVKNLRAFAGIIIVIYYLFALLGMAIFGENRVLEDLDKAANVSHLSYEKLEYFAYNFHDFAATLVLLWNIMVVNNWYIFLDGFSRATGSKFSQLYFIIWWLVSVIVTLNLFISLVIEVFVTRWEAYQGKKREEAREEQYRTRISSISSFITQSMESHSSVMPAISDIRVILSKNLIEPLESDLLHEIHQHQELLERAH